jgi:hypothetical protein
MFLESLGQKKLTAFRSLIRIFFNNTKALLNYSNITWYGSTLRPEIVKDSAPLPTTREPSDGPYQAIGKQGSAHFTAGWIPAGQISAGLGSDADKLKARRSLGEGEVFWEHKTQTSVGTAYTETGKRRNNGSGSWFVRLIFGG